MIEFRIEDVEGRIGSPIEPEIIEVHSDEKFIVKLCLEGSLGEDCYKRLKEAFRIAMEGQGQERPVILEQNRMVTVSFQANCSPPVWR